MRSMKMYAAAAVAAGITLTAAPTQAAPGIVGARPSITSRAPIPGAFMAGEASINNDGDTVLPVGTTFRVSFQEFDGTPANSTTTFTKFRGPRSTIQKVGNNEYSITLNQPLQPNARIDYIWSNNHWFNWGDRVKVVMEVSQIPGATDANPANDRAVYDNGGGGF